MMLLKVIFLSGADASVKEAKEAKEKAKENMSKTADALIDLGDEPGSPKRKRKGSSSSEGEIVSEDSKRKL
jgi:hypothetical protein